MLGPLIREATNPIAVQQDKCLGEARKHRGGNQGIHVKFEGSDCKLNHVHF